MLTWFTKKRLKRIYWREEFGVAAENCSLIVATHVRIHDPKTGKLLKGWRKKVQDTVTGQAGRDSPGVATIVFLEDEFWAPILKNRVSVQGLE